MEFDNSFEVPLPPAQAWPVLMNVRGHRAVHAGRAAHRRDRRQELQGQHLGTARPGGADLRRRGDVRGDRQRQLQCAGARAGHRRQGARLGAGQVHVPPGAGRHRLQGAGAHRPHAVGCGRAVRPRRRHDPGDGLRDHESIRQRAEGAACAEQARRTRAAPSPAAEQVPPPSPRRFRRPPSCRRLPRCRRPPSRFPASR